ncbi:MAG: molecular chaperone HtpG [Neisseriales bacterium]|nr:MAG: molecular chaperone HtpG [Neisseriales bacterium]
MPTETFAFQTEVKQLLHLMIHSLYSNKEIFLRELISNASDAADKLRFAALAEPALLEADPHFKISVAIDQAQHTITVTDNGIGMSKAEVIENLGTIAKSGTQAFLSSLKQGDKANMQLIGQFGVGFYSVFMVADKVTLKTRRAGLSTHQGVLWTSSGEGEYEVSDIDCVMRGTQITLHLKPAETAFLSAWTLRRIIQTYSDHIAIPIEMDKITATDGSDQVVKVDEKEVINQASALWMRPKNTITDEQYHTFFQHISHDATTPLAWTHAHLEGKQRYTMLLYIPAQAPADLYHPNPQRRLRLYVRRIFIMEAATQLLPNYLRFIQGVIDSDDLPLNVSREILQASPNIEAIKNGCTKKVLDLLDGLAKDQPDVYQQCWQAFGQVLKEGVVEDLANRDRLTQLLRFHSTYETKEIATVSFADYISRMKPEQDKIYVMTAENLHVANHSPHLEIFRQQGIEVLLLVDRVDEWLLASLPNVAGKPLQSVAKGELDLKTATVNQPTVTEKADVDNIQVAITKMEAVLGEKVSKVRTTKRLVDSPACLVVEENEMSQHLARLLKEVGQITPKATKPILEINVQHPLVQRLIANVAQPDAADLSVVLYCQALLTSGGTLSDPSAFVTSMNRLMINTSSQATNEHKVIVPKASNKRSS